MSKSKDASEKKLCSALELVRDNGLISRGVFDRAIVRLKQKKDKVVTIGPGTSKDTISEAVDSYVADDLGRMNKHHP